MSFTKVTTSDRTDKGVTGLADTPNLTTTAMQTKFDELGNLGIDALNKHIDELEASTASASIGATAPTGITADSNLQAVLAAMEVENQNNTTNNHTHANKTLLDAVTASYTTADKANLDSNTSARHTHANKALLDTYTQTEANLASAVTNNHTHSNKSVLDTITSALLSTLNTVATMFASITGVETTVTDDDTKMPTGGAIVDYVAALGGGDMLKATYDANSNGVVDNSEALETHPASYFATASDLTAEVSNRETAITNEVTNRNTAISTAVTAEATTRAAADYTWYHATFAAASFAAVTVTKADGTTTVTEYKCTVSVAGITATTLLTDLEYRPTGVPDTDETTKGIYGTIVSYESGAGTVSVYMSETPSADIILWFKGRETA